MSLAPCLAILGTGSDVGKSFLTAAILRYYKEHGIKVAPFKAQNMSNNSHVTSEGLEMGRAQAVQAFAAGVEPTVKMNPVLLKPSAENRSQLVFMGQPQERYEAKEYFKKHDNLFAACLAELTQLRQEYDLIVIEGAGSAVELNLWEKDLSNLKLAQAVNAKILLVGDISRGGIFAQLIGSHFLFPDWAKKNLIGFLVNRFFGDMSLFEDGKEIIEEKTGTPLLGVIPEAKGIPFESEDAYQLQRQTSRGESGKHKIGWIHLPHISNSTDLMPLEQDENFELVEIRQGQSLAEFAFIILPGSKAVTRDLEWLKKEGLDQEIQQAAKEDKWILGICGGYQMLGHEILDPLGLEGGPKEAMGLGLLTIQTEFQQRKKLSQVQATLDGISLSGYEIHQGVSSGEKNLFQIIKESGQATTRTEGNRQGNVIGSYLHGLLDQAPFRHWLLTQAIADYDPKKDHFTNLQAQREESFGKISAHLQEHCDMPFITSKLGLAL